jgi:hypothetical protein
MLGRFFQKLFKRTQPSLETLWSEKRGDKRYLLNPRDNVRMHFLVHEKAEEGKTVEAIVSNISQKGVRVDLVSPEDNVKFKKDLTVVSSLRVDDFDIPMTVRVARLVGDCGVGIEFVPPYPRELSRLHQYLEPRYLGASVREISAANLKSEKSHRLRWFQGENQTNLFVWERPETGEIARWQLSIFGHLIEEESGSVRTARIKEDSLYQMDHPGWFEEKHVAFDPILDQSQLDVAEVLINSTLIDDKVKRFIIGKIKSQRGSS